MKQELTPLGMKRLNSMNMTVPPFVKAARGPVVVPDLDIVIGETPVNLFKEVGENRLYKSTTLKHALDTGLVIAVAQTTDDIIPLNDEEDSATKNKVAKKK